MAQTEEQQIEDIKQFWEKWGKYIIIAAIALISGLVGGQAWNNYQNDKKEKTSNIYSQMIEAIQADDMSTATSHGSKLVESYGDSAYAVMAALALAKIEVEKGDLQTAKSRLSWAMERTSLDSIKHVARLRLAQLMIDSNELDQALDQLTVPDVGGFAGAYSALKGDVYAKQGKVNEARIAYEAALGRSDLASQIRQFVQMKLDNLGGNTQVAGADS